MDQVNVLLHAGVEFDIPRGDQNLLPIQMTKRAETRELLIRAKERADPNVRSSRVSVKCFAVASADLRPIVVPENSLLRHQSQITKCHQRRGIQMSYSLKCEAVVALWSLYRRLDAGVHGRHHSMISDDTRFCNILFREIRHRHSWSFPRSKYSSLSLSTGHPSVASRTPAPNTEVHRMI